MKRAEKISDASAQRGFSLIEVMVSVTVVGIVSASMFASIIFISKSSFFLSNHSDMASKSRYALEYLSRDSITVTDVKRAQSDRFWFVVEDPDGNSYEVRYQRQTDNKGKVYLARRTRESGSWKWDTLIDPGLLKNVEFTYYDSQDAAARSSSLDDVKKVNVRLEMESSFGTEGRSMTQADTIYSARYVLRNRATSN